MICYQVSLNLTQQIETVNRNGEFLCSFSGSYFPVLFLENVREKTVLHLIEMMF